MSYEANTHAVTLPTGKEAVVKEFTGRSESILADENLTKQGKMTTKLIQQFTLTIDGEKTNEKQIQDLYTADRRALLIAARIATFGSIVEFEHTCTNPRCGEVNEISVDLDDPEQLKWTPMPENVEQEVLLPASRKLAKVGPLTGSAEMQMARLGTNDALINQMLLYLREVEGLSNAQWRPFLNDASARDTKAIRTAAEGVEFGPETSIEFNCFSCQTEQRVELTNQLSFFFPETV